MPFSGDTHDPEEAGEGQGPTLSSEDQPPGVPDPWNPSLPLSSQPCVSQPSRRHESQRKSLFGILLTEDDPDCTATSRLRTISY